MRVRVKICGITRLEDALVAAAAGADALGFVFYDQSPRNIDVVHASSIISALPPFVTTVGLFVNAKDKDVRAVLDQVPLDMLQFHGAESPEYCRQFARPYMKAIRMRADIDLAVEATRFESAQALLVDAYVAGIEGGSGECFDWTRIPKDLAKPVVLAGGLEPANVGEAIRIARPYAVDVSSGVEQNKGIKDAAKIASFIKEVENAQ